MDSADSGSKIVANADTINKVMGAGKKRYYAVANGRKTGVFDQWSGPEGAQRQVTGYSGAVYKKFQTLEDARQWLESNAEKAERPAGNQIADGGNDKPYQDAKPLQEVTIYTDGGCINNPGPGGYGAVLIYKGCRKEISGGFRMTTNNRMELTACIEGLKQLKRPCSVTLHSDSRYVVDGVSKGWARRWKAKGWMRNKKEPALNADLWSKLLDLCDKHRVTLKWVKGHAGIPENERCDHLANQAAVQSGWPPDPGYEGS